MSRLPPFIRKNAATTVATATAATPATDMSVCSNNSGCSSSNPLGETPNTAPTVAIVAAVAAANAADQFSERWRDLFEERAAIMEFDGGLSRSDAEASALLDLAQIWQSENAVAANEGRECAFCGKPGACTPILADQGYAWLHRHCWKPMIEARQRQALDAVQALLGPRL